MAYQAGDTILDDEYNTFVNNATSPYGWNHFAGSGGSEYGLGETAINTVSAGNTITASDWNTLFTNMDTISGHTGDTLTTRSAVSAGDTIAIKAAVAADLATMAASVAAGCPSTTAVTTSATLQSPSSSATWYGSFTTEVSATFANADKMRHFFNAGGKVRITPVRTGTGGLSGASGKDGSWDALYSALGTLTIASQSSTRSGSGETLQVDGLANGFHDLGTSYTTIIQLSDDTYPYTANVLSVQAKLDAFVGSAVTITIKTIATDGASDATFDNPNTSGVDAQTNRNGQHEHRLSTINTTTAGGLTNAHSPSSTATVSNTTT